ncbi:permease [Polaromonas sp.]|uniref:AmpG family muropeptide MFS transporter n=1 Tax=Polaromonas sp. TaxID=1869339 RepID=UPI00326354FF
MSETLPDKPLPPRQPTPLPETPPSLTTPARPSWAETLRVYLEPPTLRMLLLGFSAGLPLLLVFGTLSFWLREAGIDRTTIGYLSWVGLAYGFKWVWAPLVDRLPIPLLTRLLGRRRSWLLLSQGVIMAALVGMALTDPKIALLPVVWCALAVAFGSATQDIALDAFRIESADVQRQAALAAAYQTGYRMAMIWAGAGVLWIAARAEVVGAGGVIAYQHGAWQTAYLVMAASMLLGVVTVLFSPEPIQQALEIDSLETAATRARFSSTGVPLYGLFLLLAIALLLSVLLLSVSMKYLSALVLYSMFFVPLLLLIALVVGLAKTGLIKGLPENGWRVPLPQRLVPAATWFTHAFYIPFADFLRRYGKHALLILSLIAVYRISDVVMGIMANPFYVDMGYTKDEVAAVTKIYGVIMTLVGAFVGGALAMRFGVMRVLMLGAVLSAGSNLLFAWLGSRGHDVSALIFVISADNLSSGIASAAFIAYLSSLTNINYSATQYALFSSMMLLLPKFLAGYSGTYVDAFGYSSFFMGTALLGVPVLLLVWLASRMKMPSNP